MCVEGKFNLNKMEIKIQLTEEEIQQRKKEWIDAQLQQYYGIEY